MAPFYSCTTQSPAYVVPFTLNGERSLEFYWTQKGYDGTRMDRGAEACSRLDIRKEGWSAFRFYMPSPGFPTNKDGAIAQIFAENGCSSWAAMVEYHNNTMIVSHRSSCGGPAQPILSKDIQRNTWIPVIMHFVISHQNKGLLEIWYGDAPEANPTYRYTGNFAWGQWSGDSLNPAIGDNMIKLKIGMYNFQYGNYDNGEERRLYYDNVTQINGNPPNAWSLVNPMKAVSATSALPTTGEPFTFSLSGQGVMHSSNYGKVTGVRIVDTRGNLIQALTADTQSLTWDAKDGRGRLVPNGVYYVTLNGPARSATFTINNIRKP